MFSTNWGVRQLPSWCSAWPTHVDDAVAGRLGPDVRPAPREALAGEDADELVAQALVRAEQERDLARAGADVARGDVRVRADVPGQLGHERRAEAADLAVGLALGVEVRAALAAAHGEPRERVLERLLEAEELEDRQVHGRVQAQAALVRPERGVVLPAIRCEHTLEVIRGKRHTWTRYPRFT
jgi:hypothetical protein